MYYLDLESDTKTSFGSDREYNAFYISRFTYACTKYKKIEKGRYENTKATMLRKGSQYSIHYTQWLIRVTTPKWPWTKEMYNILRSKCRRGKTVVLFLLLAVIHICLPDIICVRPLLLIFQYTTYILRVTDIFVWTRIRFS